MFCWFERRGQFIRYEARESSGRYELCVVEPDGSERVEHFDDSRDLARRQAEFESQVKNEGWTGPHGWNL